MFLLLLRSYTSFSSSRAWNRRPFHLIQRKHLLNLSADRVWLEPGVSVKPGCWSYHLEGAVLRWAKFDAFIDKSVEVALADVGGNFGAKLSGDDRALHWTALQTSRHAEHAMNIQKKQAAAPTVDFGGGGYLHGGCVRHPLLHDSGWGLGQDAGSGLGLYSQVTLAGGWHSTGSWFNRADADMACDSFHTNCVTAPYLPLRNRSTSGYHMDKSGHHEACLYMNFKNTKNLAEL